MSCVLVFFYGPECCLPLGSLSGPPGVPLQSRSGGKDGGGDWEFQCPHRWGQAQVQAGGVLIWRSGKD